ncbi:hypothetical protein Btru_019285 [Bulinus truncatus]|nr:hypothetical protein Btru_019285 [Bulinus truncatus]
MANYSEFNNNNYLPGLYNNNEMAATVFNNFPSAQHYRNPVLSQNSFTFTSPTQGITPATHRPCIQTTSSINNMSAPGVGTSWQHSIPVTMPWVDTVNFRGAGTTTVFTGTPLPTCPEILTSDVPLKRPKRKALDLPDEAPLSKVYLCADQFAHMTITPQEQSGKVPVTDDSKAVQVYFESRETQCQSDTQAWQRFRDIENSLDIELDEDIGGNIGHVKNVEADGPRLRIVEGILDSARQSPILPRKVMAELTKPCMQIVLWKSPGELIRDVSKDENQTKTSSASTTNTFKDSTALSTVAGGSVSYSYMNLDNDGDLSADKCSMNTNHSLISEPLVGTNILNTRNDFSASLPSSLVQFSCPSNQSIYQVQSDDLFETIDDDDMQL